MHTKHLRELVERGKIVNCSLKKNTRSLNYYNIMPHTCANMLAIVSRLANDWWAVGIF